jgi:hypothetical protein
MMSVISVLLVILALGFVAVGSVGYFAWRSRMRRDVTMEPADWQKAA